MKEGSEKPAEDTKIEVLWPDDDEFYPGIVQKYNDNGYVHILYDDGDV